MKTISKERFEEEISEIYGNTTCFIADSPENRYNYDQAEVSDESLQPFMEAEKIEVEYINFEKGLIRIMKDNCVGVNADEMFRFGKIYKATNGKHVTYMLIPDDEDEREMMGQAVCRSHDDDSIIRFLDSEEMTAQFVDDVNNGEVWGVYYNDKGDIVYEDYVGIVKPLNNN